MNETIILRNDRDRKVEITASKIMISNNDFDEEPNRFLILSYRSKLYEIYKLLDKVNNDRLNGIYHTGGTRELELIRYNEDDEEDIFEYRATITFWGLEDKLQVQIDLECLKYGEQHQTCFIDLNFKQADKWIILMKERLI